MGDPRLRRVVVRPASVEDGPIRPTPEQIAAENRKRNLRAKIAHLQAKEERQSQDARDSKLRQDKILLSRLREQDQFSDREDWISVDVISTLTDREWEGVLEIQGRFSRNRQQFMMNNMMAEPGQTPEVYKQIVLDAPKVVRRFEALFVPESVELGAFTWAFREGINLIPKPFVDVLDAREDSRRRMIERQAAIDRSVDPVMEQREMLRLREMKRFERLGGGRTLAQWAEEYMDEVEQSLLDSPD